MARNQPTPSRCFHRVDFRGWQRTGVVLSLGRKPFAALGPAGVENSPTADSRLTGPEAVAALAHQDAGLKCPFHSFLRNIRRRRPSKSERCSAVSLRRPVYSFDQAQSQRLAEAERVCAKMPQNRTWPCARRFKRKRRNKLLARLRNPDRLEGKGRDRGPRTQAIARGRGANRIGGSFVWLVVA